MCLRPEDQPSDRDGGCEIGEFGVGRRTHRSVGFGAEILDYYFLNVTELPTDPPDGVQRIGALRQRLADADEQTGREGHGSPTRVGEGAQAHLRVLVGRAEVRRPGSGPEPVRRRLQHHPHARSHRTQPLQISPTEHTRVEMRQQPGLLQHRDRARPEIVQCGVIATVIEPLPGRLPPELGLVSESEQGLCAAGRGAGSSDLDHLVTIEERRRHPVRHRGEGAVVAPVATQPSQWNEDLARIGDLAGPPSRDQARVAHRPRRREQPFKVVVTGVQQHLGLGDVDRRCFSRTPQCPAHRRSGGVHTGIEWL